MIAVAASDSQDRLASFSNFGVESVDLLAPGVGIRSTLPGGGYGSANGTSMASPHVAGSAALIWSAFPNATVDEVRQAIVSTVDPVTRGDEIVSTGGRLNVGKAIKANVFAPAARVIARETITDSTMTSGKTTTEFTVEYSHRDGIDLATIDSDDLIVTRQWGPAVELPVTLSSKTPTAEGALATYIVDAPGSGSFSNALPVAIENTLPTVFTNNTAVSIDSGPANTITSQIVVDNILSPVSNLVVSLDIDHTFDSDLTAKLVAPDGTRAVLFSSVGGSNDNFTGTVLGDSAATSITAGAASFTGSFRPQASITPLAAAGANGTWTLEITDGNDQDGGSLKNWSLSILETSTTSTTSQILVRDVSESVADFTVSVDIEHASVGDLAATLIAPDGSRAVLFANVGGTADNFTGTIFDDTAATSISVGPAPFTGTFSPQENLAPLGGSGPNGIWTLELENGSSLGSAQLLEWSLNFSGSWDPLDFGDYVISTVADNVSSGEGKKTESREIGSFNVKINDPSVIYVDTFSDAVGSGSLRDAIIAANAASPAARTIILDSGTYTINIPAEVDPNSTFGTSLNALGIDNPGGWSNATTGDFDVEGNVTIIGDTNDDTVIDAQGLDRVLKVYPTASLSLARLTVQGGVSPTTQGGGGILSVGELDLQQVIARENIALGADEPHAIFGGAIAAWGGNTSLNESWLTENQADFGGGIYYGGKATGVVQRSTLSDNQGGGLYSYSSEDISVENSTFSANSGGYGAIANGIFDNYFQANSVSDSPSLSADGRYVTFVSRANNLVPGDNNGTDDIFVFDRTTGTIERVSVSDAGVEGNDSSFSPALSADGRYVTFESRASNLVPGDNNGATDIFVYDRTTGTIEPITYRAFRSVVDVSHATVAFSFELSTNAAIVGDVDVLDSLFVATEGSTDVDSRTASSLGTNIFSNVLKSNLIAPLQRLGNLPPVHQLIAGNPAIDAADPSGDGTRDQLGNIRVRADFGAVEATTASVRGIVYVDRNHNGRLDPDEPGTSGVQVTVTGTTQSTAISGTDNLQTPLISEEGVLNIDGLIPGEHEFTVQTVTGWTASIPPLTMIRNQSLTGNGFSDSPALSADGRYVTFSSRTSNLVPGDNNSTRDIFIAINPLATPGVTRDLQAGEIFTELNFGLVPDPGTISGIVFEDVVANGIYDAGEPALDNSVTVFLDLNGDQVLDDGEPSVTTDTDGSYQFLDIDAFRSYEVAVQAPVAFEQVTPGVNEDFVWDIFLPAGGAIGDRDFGFRPVTSTGQSSDSAVSGRLYDDRNGNGVFDNGVDIPLANREVYLDATNFGIRDSNEPRVLTDSEGRYSIPGLSSRTVAVTTTLDETLVHVSPLGSDFSREKFPLFDAVTPFANPQAIAAGDFNADGFQDVAVALGQGNKLSIRLNDGAGGFLPDEIDIALGEGGAGPTSLVVGQFDVDPRLDVALTANFSSNVVVLLNFDAVSNTFTFRATPCK